VLADTHRTVLIVDDDPGVTATFARMLRLEGYVVLTALTVEAGLREVAVAHPDAVLLDLRMPIVDGLTFLRRLRATEIQRHTPVAIVTGDYWLDESLLGELRALDASVFFKPVWFEDLIGITQHLVRSPAAHSKR
jgi:two-component system response regulator MprA